MKALHVLGVWGGLALWAATLGGCISNGASDGTAPSPERLGVASESLSGDGGGPDCSCSGTDVNGNPVTTNTCGQAVCGADDLTWVCTVNGFAYQGDACAADAAASSCNCSGTDVNGNPVTTTTCGQSCAARTT